jgi:hypothetical protein
LQLDSLLPRSLPFSERVSVWEMLLATPPLQAKQQSQPVTLSLQTFCACDVFSRAKAIPPAIPLGWVIELAPQKRSQWRLLK